MARWVAERLDRGARDDALRSRFVRALLIGSRLRELGRSGRADAHQLGDLFRVLWEVDGRRLVSSATSFFWRGLHRCAARLVSGSHAESDFIAVLACQAFDAFFEILPDQTAVTLSGTGPFRAVLPRLGLILPRTEGPVVLRRTGGASLDVRAPGLRLEVDRQRVDPALRLARSDVPGAAPARVLAVREPMLYEDPLDLIDPDPRSAESLASEVGEALDLVQSADPELGHRAREGIRWYLPLRRLGERSDRSFSVFLLSDVVFLSRTNPDQLAENVVHELSHNDLYLLQEVVDLFDDDGSEQYYSPWRDDPRPLHGLVHALHVFSEIADFLERLEDVASTAAAAGRRRGRRLTIARQLRLGLAQVAREKLTPAGRALIEEVRETTRRHERRLGIRAGHWPDEVASHLSTWATANPDLAGNVKVPEGL